MKRTTITLLIAALVSATILVACLPSSNDLAGTSWKLVSYGPVANPNPVVADSVTDLSFGRDGKVSGNLGCNSFGGDYSTSNGKVVFGELSSTLMACVEARMTQENIAFTVMTGTASYKKDDRNLTITNASNDVILSFQQK